MDEQSKTNLPFISAQTLPCPYHYRCNNDSIFSTNELLFLNMNDTIQFRKARAEELSDIWPLFAQGIEKRRLEGSEQWQDGYPNPNSIASDIEKGYGYVCIDLDGDIVGYVALIFDIEPAYDELEGEWLSNGKYAGIHRLVVSQDKKIRGLGTWMMQQIEVVVLEKQIYSIKADTNHDNAGMLRVFDKMGYIYCGTVYFRGSARRAYEKILN